MGWKYYEPQFECDSYNYSLLKYSPWSGHRNFAYDFMVYKNPGTLVELGSHYGSSLFSFAQAVKDYRLGTVLFAVDTWEGDDYTRKYDESVYESFQRIKTHCYDEVNIQMIRCTFDEAVEKFSDNSIDILHIDGSHHYEDVKHDFENWKSRVKPDGIVMFHDISRDKVLGETMGSCVYWNEIKKQYPFTLEFQHSFGLGLLFFNKKDFEFFRDKVDLDEYQQKNNELDNQFKDALRTEYFVKKDWDFIEQDLKSQLKIKDEHLERYSVDVKEKEQYIRKLENDIDTIRLSYEDTVTQKEQYILQLESDIKKINTSNEKDNIERSAYIKDLEMAVQKVEDAYKKTIQEKDIYIGTLESTMQSVLDEKKQQSESLTEYSQQIKCLKSELLSNQQEIQHTKQQFDSSMQELNATIQELDATRRELNITSQELAVIKQELDITKEHYQHTIHYKISKILKK